MSFESVEFHIEELEMEQILLTLMQDKINQLGSYKPIYGTNAVTESIFEDRIKLTAEGQGNLFINQIYGDIFDSRYKVYKVTKEHTSILVTIVVAINEVTHDFLWLDHERNDEDFISFLTKEKFDLLSFPTIKQTCEFLLNTKFNFCQSILIETQGDLPDVKPYFSDEDKKIHKIKLLKSAQYLELPNLEEIELGNFKLSFFAWRAFMGKLCKFICAYHKTQFSYRIDLYEEGIGGYTTLNTRY
jgi:hypothetical protein